MTIAAETARSGPYTGNGVTTVFAYAFKALDEAHLIVTQTVIATGAETVKTLTTHYTVSGVGVDGGGNVTMLTAPPSTATLTITRLVPRTQTTDLVNRGAVVPTTLETAFDRGVQMAQDAAAVQVRTLKLPVSVDTSTVSTELAAPVANAYLLWNGTATALTSTGSSASQYLGGDGTAALPFYSFSSDPDCGLYRIGANNIALSLNASKVVDFLTTGISVTGTITASSTLVASGALTVATTSTLTGVTTHGGNVVSDTDSTDDLGTTGVRWANLWVDAITVTNDQAISGNLTVTGDLTVNGTTVTQNAANLLVEDPLIELNTGAASNANDLGLLMERGSTGDNVFVGWDESGDFFLAGTTTATGSSTGNITYTLAPAQFASIALTTGATVTGVADEDNMVSNSDTLLATQQSIKAYVDTASAAPGIQMTWSTAIADADQGAGRVWGNNATLASVTVLYIDDVENNAVSINAFVGSLDDPTASNSAMVYIAEGGVGGAGAVFKVSGAVTSASTYSKVAVTYVANWGTLSNADIIGVTFAFSGDNGNGDLLAANNLSDLANASTARTNLSLGTMATQAASAVAITGGTMSGVPIDQQSKSVAYTTVLADGGKHILHPTADNNARTFTIDSNANVAYPTGTTITFLNQVNTVTIAITTDTMTLYPDGTTGSRTLAAYGQATAIKIASTSWVITGVGLT